MLLPRTCWIAAVVCSWSLGIAGADQVLLKVDKDTKPDAVTAQDATVSIVEGALRVVTGHSNPWPGVTLKAPGGRWDLTNCGHVAVDVRNAGSNNVDVFCRVDNPGADGTIHCLTGQVSLKPGEKKLLKLALARKMPAEIQAKLFGMRGYPGGWSDGRGIDPSQVNQVLIFVSQPKVEHVLEIASVCAGGEAMVVPAEPNKLFPMIDRYGQYVHKDWPGKTKSEEDLAKRRQEEEADLAARQGPEGWNVYGGWQAGPQLKASGRFRVEKHQGRWWFVDPEGRLFWSHGADCVDANGATTPISDREHLFADLPAKDSPFGPFYGRAAWAPHGYYAGKGSYQTYNFTGANLLRKYGQSWPQTYDELCHRRLRSWGMNTIANWSDGRIYHLRKTPYVVTVGGSGKPLQGSSGYWGKFPDPFDASLKQSLERGMAEQKGHGVGDPWCLGYFLGNELSWGEDLSLALAALASPAEQEAKKVFVADLEKKYETIERLNEAWGTSHASWDALLGNTALPDKNRKAVRDDLAAFHTKAAEQYFRVCRDAVKEADPEGLYLGCRFAWANEPAIRAAAKYCDVVSFNRYERSVARLRLPQGCDKPMIIGEFHFGALDRGMFHTGLVPTASQDERAAAYREYVRGAIEHPAIIGTHWFQFGDQATTGRGDGENYQIGLLDVCDTPYAETIRACREVGYEMYERRLQAGSKTARPEPHTLTAVGLKNVVIDDEFWAPKRKIWQEVTIPDCLAKFEKDGAIANFEKIRDGQTGAHGGPPWYDGLIYEMIRAGADFLVGQRDEALEKRLDGYIDRIADAQAKDADGYLNTYTQLAEPTHRWGQGGGNDNWQHDLYNAGALAEAAVHYYQATGKTRLLKVAARLTNHMCDVMGAPPKKNIVPGHPLAEEAVLQLYLLLTKHPELKDDFGFPVDESRYLKLVEFWLENRGNHEGRKSFESYAQDHEPLLKQETLEGHSVRATLLCAGLVTAATINGREDYYEAAVRLWNNMAGRRTHLTGSVGAVAGYEGFAGDYVLPNKAYLETCAAIGAGFFHHRMNLAFADAKYVDEFERALLNGALAGVSLKGDAYFYENPLEGDKKRARWAWHPCPCCPPMFVKIMGALPGYVYATDQQGVYVNLFVGSRAEIALPVGTVRLTQKTRYPWDGKITLAVELEKPTEFALNVRIPSWCRAGLPDDLYQTVRPSSSGPVSLRVNGQPVGDIEMVRGYARLRREWRSGDLVELTLEMPVREVQAHAKVKDNAGRLALMRGPLVYCLESIDNPAGLQGLSLGPEASYSSEYRGDLLGGVVVIRGPARVTAPGSKEAKAVDLLAIPYYANSNRGPADMTVWIAQALDSAAPKPSP